MIQPKGMYTQQDRQRLLDVVCLDGKGDQGWPPSSSSYVLQQSQYGSQGSFAASIGSGGREQWLDLLGDDAVAVAHKQSKSFRCE